MMDDENSDFSSLLQLEAIRLCLVRDTSRA